MTEIEEVDILVKNADWIITMDEARRILRSGAVAISGDKVKELGRHKDLEIRYRGKRTIDGRGKIVLPGFIEGHCHNTQHLARGVGDEVDSQRWLFERMYPFEAQMSQEEAHLAALLCQLEMIKAGTTCFIDPGSYFPEETGKAAEKSGMRGIICRTSFDQPLSAVGRLPEGFIETPEKALARAEEVVKEWHGALNDRIRAGFSIRVIQNYSDSNCLKIKELADQYGVLVQSHIAAVIWSARDIERLQRLGIIDQNWLMTHMGWVAPWELRMLKEKNVKVAHCPGASLHGAYGSISHGRFPEMIEMGIIVCLGSDSAAAGNYVDMIRNMYLACCCFKDARLDARVMSPETVLEMATLNGAKAAMWEEKIGSLEAGKKADIAIFDINRPEWKPTLNPISNLVYSATGASADTVIVDGKILMEVKEVLTLNEQEILLQSQEAAERLMKRAGLEEAFRSRWPIVN